MTILIGGIAACFLGLLGILIWWPAFLTVLTGAVPPILILGGALAIFLGIDTIREKARTEALEAEEAAAAKEREKEEKAEEEKKG
jgi:hypothetical protein